MKKIIILTFCLIYSNSLFYSQSSICQYEGLQQQQVIPKTGLLKALVIFVKFYDDNAVYPEWDNEQFVNTRPEWTEAMLNNNPLNGPVNPSFSGYFKNSSFNKITIYGDSYPQYPDVYIPFGNIEFYKSTNCGGERAINWLTSEALLALDPQIDYSQYDNYKSDGTPGSDGYVDFIIFWFRDGYFGSTDGIKYSCNNSYDGIANLGGRSEVFVLNGSPVSELTTMDGVSIKPGNGFLANGFSSRKIDIMAHETSHLMGLYLHGGIGHYAKWSLTEAVTGVGIPLTLERNLLGWLPDITNQGVYTIYPGDVGTHNLTLYDYETTNEEGKDICIHIELGNKVIRLENRSGIGFYSKLGNWVLPGNGLLAYSNQNLYSADHIWSWRSLGIPDCGDCPNKYNQKFEFNNGCIKSFPTISGQQDIDLFGICTSIGCGYDIRAEGDAGDLFNPGYNTVLSTWSNPSLGYNYFNNFPIVIEHLGKNSDSSINIRIKMSQDAYQNTSPSKPLYLQTSKEYVQPGRWHPKLAWITNTEPDIQKYKVLRGLVTDPNTDPNYILIASNVTVSSYIDNEIYLYDRGGGSGPCTYVERSYSYRIIAIDTEAKESVRSDRSLITGWHAPCDPNDGPSIEELSSNTPSEYSVCNYPNPFNPITNIRFSLPVSGRIIIKVYNILGEEVLSVTDNLEAGDYSIPFDGTNLPSGIYVYSLESDSFYQAKKMVLVK